LTNINAYASIKIMNNTPHNENRAQAFLYNQGTKRLGDTAPEHTPAEVRREGVKRVGTAVVGLAAAAGAVVGANELVDYAFDHSPTVQYQKEHQGVANQLDQDPTKAVVHVTPPTTEKR
jgi:hypothetical protein